MFFTKKVTVPESNETKQIWATGIDVCKAGRKKKRKTP